MTGTVQGQQAEAFFFENEGERLFGVLHTPAVRDRGVGIVLCDPFGEEKHYTYRTFVNFARRACDEGFHVLRFDYRGNGDSAGEREDNTPARLLSDINRAVDLMTGRLAIRRVGLLGLRLGGTLAALAANTDPRTEFLVLWAPVMRPKEHFDGLFRQDLIAASWSGNGTKMPRQPMEVLEAGELLEMRGCTLNKRAYTEFAGIDLADLDWGSVGQCLIADVTRDSRRYDEVAKRLRSTLASGRDEPEISVVEESEFWTSDYVYQGTSPDELCSETLEWLKQKIRP